MKLKITVVITIAVGQGGVFLVYHLIVFLAFVCVVVYVFMFLVHLLFFVFSFLIVNCCLFGRMKMNIINLPGRQT